MPQMKGHMDKEQFEKEHKDFDKKVGLMLSSKRLMKGVDRGKILTQSNVSEIIAKTFQQIQKYEKGNNSCSGFTMLCLFKGLGVSIPQLVQLYLSIPVQEIQGGKPDKILLGQVPTPNNPRLSSEYVDVDAQNKSV